MAKQGYKWQLKVAAEGGSPSYTTVGKAADVDLMLDGDALDTTTRDDAGWKATEQGLKSWSSSVKHLWVPSDASYVVLQAAYFAGTKVLCQFSESSATGAKGFDGQAIIKKLGVPQPIGGKVEVTIELQGDGALTPVTRA